MSNETVKAVETIYSEIGEQFGDRGLKIAHLMQGAFARGLGSEPDGQVDKGKGNARALEMLLNGLKEDTSLEFDVREGWPGFVYFIENNPNKRAVLGDQNNDPLMYKVIELAEAFHRPVAERRSKQWFDDTLTQTQHRNNVQATVREFMADISRNLKGEEPPFLPDLIY